jgi:predicted nuclease of predicted toxin-antitoxin system
VRIIADENFPGDTVDALRRRGHDVIWVRTDAPGSTDNVILTRAQRDTRLLVTFDKGFGELAFRSGLPVECGVILFRIPPVSTDFVSRVILTALESRDDWAGHFSVVEPGAVRMTPLRRL